MVISVTTAKARRMMQLGKFISMTGRISSLYRVNGNFSYFLQLQAVFLSLTFSSVQFKMVAVRSEKPICVLRSVPNVSSLKWFQCSSD